MKVFQYKIRGRHVHDWAWAYGWGPRDEGPFRYWRACRLCNRMAPTPWPKPTPEQIESLKLVESSHDNR